MGARRRTRGERRCWTADGDGALVGQTLAFPAERRDSLPVVLAQSWRNGEDWSLGWGGREERGAGAGVVIGRCVPTPSWLKRAGEREKWDVTARTSPSRRDDCVMPRVAASRPALPSLELFHPLFVVLCLSYAGTASHSPEDSLICLQPTSDG